MDTKTSLFFLPAKRFDRLCKSCLVLSLVLLLPACAAFGGTDQENGFHVLEVMEGQEAFIGNVNAMQQQDMKGILPLSLKSHFLPNDPNSACDPSNHTSNRSNFCFKDPDIWNEFFIFDQRTLIVILKSSPKLYFIKINSDLFYSHCLAEFRQIKRGKSGRSGSNKKSISTSPFLKQVGDFKVEVYFSPTEITFGTTSSSESYKRMRQAGSQRPRPEIWRLLEAAQDVELSFPRFEDDQMHADFLRHIGEGKKRTVYSPHFSLSGLNGRAPSYGITKDAVLPFYSISGRNLQMTEELIDGEDRNFEDPYELTRDFLALFSLFPGNPGVKGDTNNPSDALLNVRDGIVILIRGPMTRLQGSLDNEKPPPNEAVGRPAEPGEVVISEVGINHDGDSNNDYIVLYNTTPDIIALSSLYIGRDSSCTISSGNWTEFKSFLSGTLVPYQYYLISRSGSSLDADFTWSGSISADYCLVLANSSDKPISATATNVVDFVSFNAGHIDMDPLLNESTGEGGTRPGELSGTKAFNRGDTCMHMDTNNNMNDFMEKQLPPPKNSSSSACTPTAPIPPNLVISEVGVDYAGDSDNDYIVLYNPTATGISLSGLYIGRDSSCSISGGNWTEFDPLPNYTLPPHQYYLISRSTNTLTNVDFTWSGSLSSNYCVALAELADPSDPKPDSATHTSVIDFVSFKDDGTGEGGSRPGVLSGSKAFARGTGDTCMHIDTNNNANDFMERQLPPPKNSSSSTCDPTVMPPLPPPPLPDLVISEVGVNYAGDSNNDYIVLYNPTSASISLDGLHIGRDDDCSIGSGWTEFQALPNGTIPAHQYYLISRSTNTLTNVDTTWNGSLSSNYCVVLTNSSTEPISVTAANVVDFVSFKSGIGENGTRAGELSTGTRAFTRNGTCMHIDTDNNPNNDFTQDNSPPAPKNSSSSTCDPAAIPPPPPPPDLVISEVGVDYAGDSNNDYIVLYNPTSSDISLNGLFIGRDASCTISSSSWTEFDPLPNDTLPSHQYYLISRTTNSLSNVDFTWSGSLGSDYCVTLASSDMPTKPDSATHTNVIDFVSFNDGSDPGESSGEGGGRPGVLSSSTKAFNRGGTCIHMDTDNNANDFMQKQLPPPKNSTSSTCNPTAPIPPNLVISEVGVDYGGDSNNDYIVLYNPTSGDISLDGLYIGRDSSCNISGGSWTEFDPLPNYTLPSHQYYLISRTTNSLSNVDFTWSGSLSSNYCVVLANSSTRPTSATHTSVIDFVSFESGSGEGGTQAGVLSGTKAFNRGNTCMHIDTNNNANDFSERQLPPPKSSASPTCAP